MSSSGRPPARRKPLPKRIAARILRLFAGRPQGAPRLKPEAIRRVLLIRYDKIGDMVITTPLIEGLHRVAPGAEIDVLAGRANASLIAKDPRIGRIHIWEKSLLKRIAVIRECRRRDYDLTLQLVLWRTTLPGLLAGLLTPRGRVTSRDNANSRELFDHTVVVDASRPYATQLFRFLAGSLDLDDHPPMEMPPYAIHIPPESVREAEERLRSEGLEKKGYILLNISAGEPSRELPDERNAELTERLFAVAAPKGLRVAVTGAPNDAGRGERIIRLAHERIAGREDTEKKEGNERKESARYVAPLFFDSLTAAAACIREARLIVTPDTGTNHIASAVGTPTVALFTKTGRPGGWGPFGVPHRIVQATEGNDASAIGIEEIAAAAADLLDSSVVP